MTDSNDGINIGQKLRSLRKIRDISLQQLSEETGMSYSYLSGLENEKHSISIINLQRLAKYFNVDLIHFLDNRDAETVFVRKDDEQDHVTEDGIVFNVITSKEGKNLQVSYVTLPPNSPTERNIHKHEKGQELIIAIEGKVVVMVESNKYQLNQGDLVIFDSDVEHWIYTEESGAKILIVSSPPYGREVVPGGKKKH
ncbi:MAG: helix-turn-helix domain-containing protein [Desulfitobacterium hafniense]